MEFISSDQFKEARVVKHNDRWHVVFGYTRTRKAPGVYVDGFEPAHHTPERKYKTEAGAVRVEGSTFSVSLTTDPPEGR